MHKHGHDMVVEVRGLVSTTKTYDRVTLFESEGSFVSFTQEIPYEDSPYVQVIDHILPLGHFVEVTVTYEKSQSHEQH